MFQPNRPAKLAGAFACGLALSLSAGTASAQLFGDTKYGLFTFSDSDKSKVKYTKPVASAKTACNRMRSQTTFGYSVLTAEMKPAKGEIPEYCRLVALINPDIKLELSLPTKWNGRLYQRGSGGHAGFPITSPFYTGSRDNALVHNFAALISTTGHDVGDPMNYLGAATDASFAEDNFAKHADYAQRSVHLSNVAARALIDTYYETGVRRAYWDGCSTGGRQGHMAAQRFPNDFDGILAGAGVFDWAGIMMRIAWTERTLAETPIPPAKIAGVVRQGVYGKCDELDGMKDGILTNPKACDFNPEKDLPICKAGADSDDCLTRAQAAALKKVYDGPQIPNFSSNYPYPVGGEAPNYRGVPAGKTPPSMWERTLTSPFHTRVVDNFFKYLAFPVNNPEYDWREEFEFTPEGVAKFDSLKMGMMNATDPDLSAFQESGGKFIAWHGWHDMSVPAEMSIRYHTNAKAKMGPKLDDFYRLFMVSGLDHCGGGAGLNKFDGMTALIEWVEAGVEPDTILAEQTVGPHVKKARTQPMCPYPALAAFKGGDPDEAESFECRTP